MSLQKRYYCQSLNQQYFLIIYSIFILYSMKKNSFRLIFNRKRKLNSEGKALIQIEAYLNGRKIYFSSHIYIKPENWSNHKREVVNHPHHTELNRLLYEYILQLEWKELELWKMGIPIDLGTFKYHVKGGKESKSISFFDLSRNWVENSDKKESTKRNLNTTLNLLEQFFPKLKFTDLTYTMLTNFEQYLRSKNYAVNTIAKHMKHLKSIINESIKRGYMTSSPFKNYKIRTNISRHTFLLPQEIQKLEELQLKLQQSRKGRVLDAFLFCCYTGLRYSDFIQIRSSNIIVIDKQKWLVFRTQKTDIEVRLPLALLFQGKALALLQKYKDLNQLFDLPPNPAVNKILIQIGNMAGIKKHFSFHSARHTNATLLIYNGVNITTVQKLLGHKSIKTTQIYSDVFPESIVRDLRKAML